MASIAFTAKQVELISSPANDTSAFGFVAPDFLARRQKKLKNLQLRRQILTLQRINFYECFQFIQRVQQRGVTAVTMREETTTSHAFQNFILYDRLSIYYYYRRYYRKRDRYKLSKMEERDTQK